MSGVEHLVAVFLIAAGSTTIAVPASIPFLRKHATDVPNARSSHGSPIPRGGGIAVLVGILVASTFVSTTANWVVLALGAAIAGVGFIDDLASQGTAVRLGGQAVAAGLLVGWLSYGPVAPAIPRVVLLAVGGIATVGYINAFNFMDGINGISAFNAGVAGAWLGYLGIHYGREFTAILGAAILGGCLGFTPWNFPKARIFLGDVGSYGLGFLIVAGLASAWAAGADLLACVAPLVVYVTDTGWVLCRRAWARESLFRPHRGHVYQRLVDAGRSHGFSASFSAALAAACSISTLAHSAPVAVVTFAVAAGFYLNAPRLFGRTGRSVQTPERTLL